MTHETDWIEWRGGECPVEPDAIVEVRFRRPDILSLDDITPRDAGLFDWRHIYSGGLVGSSDIIAYRVVRP